MKKKLLPVMLAGILALVFGLAACGPATDSGTDAPDEAAAPAEDLGDTLVVYSTHPEELLEAIAAEFEAETGVHVEFINLKGELADRVRSEKDNPQADIMFGGDTATYMALQAEGCFAPTQPSWAGAVDASYKDADGYWYGTYRTPMVLFYNTEALDAADAPTDWADLADPRYAGQIVTRDSLSSSMRSTVSALVDYTTTQQGEDAAWAFIQALNDNTKGYYNSGSMMFEAIGKGEAAVSMAVINDVLKNRDSNGMPLEMVIPESGAVVIVDCVAKTNNAPHSAAADAFIEFLGSEKCQVLCANDYNRMPMTDQYLDQCPAWMSTEFTDLPVDWSNISDNQSAWLEKWETEYIDADKTVGKD